MITVDYSCSNLSGIEQVECLASQDFINLFYTIAGYAELCLVVFCLYVIIYKVLWCGAFRDFFIS